jgi:hypothetical protein
LTQLTGYARAPGIAVCASINLEETTAGFKDALFGFVPPLRGEHRLNTQHYGQPSMIFAGDTGVRRGHQPADRRRRQGYSLGQVARVQLQ